MHNRKYLLGFGITLGIILFVSVTSRMALRGSVLEAGTQTSSSFSSSESEVELSPIGGPLSMESLTRAHYSIADSSIRYALSAAGRTFSLDFDADGKYVPGTISSLKPTGIQSASLQLDRVAVADVDGDRRLDSVVPMTVRIGGQIFTELAVIHNNGDDTGTYSVGYPLGLGSEVQGIELSRQQGMIVKFRYTPPGASNAVDAQIVVAITKPESARQSSSSEAVAN